MEGSVENKTNGDQNMSTMHFLPCSIDYDGPVPVNSFFRIKRSKNGIKAALRGRELVGKEFTLPANVVGLNAVQNRTMDNTESSWDCVGKFDKITVWQHDISPDLSQLQESVDWFEIADSVSEQTTYSIHL